MKKAAQSSNPTAGSFSLRIKKKSWEPMTRDKFMRDLKKVAAKREPKT